MSDRTEATRRLDHGLNLMSGLDWGDLFEVNAAFTQAADLLCHPDSIGLLLGDVLNDEALLTASERRVWGDRVIVADHLADRRFRIRLHHWTEAREDPHNHRWPFAARVIDGSYLHALYGLESEMAARIPLGPMRPTQVRVEQAGDAYCISDDVVHVTRPVANAVSLIVRGPVARRTNIMLSEQTGDISLVKYGREDESDDQVSGVLTSLERIRALLSELCGRGLATDLRGVLSGTPR